MRKSLVIITVVVSFLISCNQDKELKNSLNKDEKLTSYFNSHQIEDLDRINEFFSKQLNFSNIKNQDSAYKAYFRTIDREENFDDLASKLSFAKTENMELMQKLKKDSIFDEIWINRVNLANNKTELDINQKGKFFKYLQDKKETLPFLSQYCISIETFGALGLANQAGMLKEYYKEVDFNDASVRLIFAIHYLTLVSHIEAMNITRH